MPHCLTAALAALLLSTGLPALAQDDAGQIDLVVQFLGESDPEMRAVGLQYVREQIPGAEATEKFASLLPDLPPDAQAGLVDALGERGDAAALPAVLKMVDSDADAVRIAALKAAGNLGGADQVALLADRAAGDSPAEAAAALSALMRLKGDGVDEAVLATMQEGSPEVRAAMIRVLAGRNAAGALPKVLEAAGAEQAVVRLAALDAMRRLAEPGDTAALVEALQSAPNDTERRKAQLALLTVCSRGRAACAPAIIDAIGDAKPEVQVVLLPALARAGGEKALEAVVAQTTNDNAAVADEAVRVLATWADRAAVEPLKNLAGGDEATPRQIVALRGLVRLAAPAGEDQPADLDTLVAAMDLARRPAEKCLVVGVLSRVGDAQAIDLALPLLEDDELSEAAAAAIVNTAEQLGDQGDKEKLTAALDKAIEATDNKMTRQRAEKARGTL